MQKLKFHAVFRALVVIPISKYSVVLTKITAEIWESIIKDRAKNTSLDRLCTIPQINQNDLEEKNKVNCKIITQGFV